MLTRSAKIGQLYRDTVKNVVGKAAALSPEGMVQLKLRPEHIEGSAEHTAMLFSGKGTAELAHDLRWYEPDRLEAVDAG